MQLLNPGKNKWHLSHIRIWWYMLLLSPNFFFFKEKILTAMSLSCWRLFHWCCKQIHITINQLLRTSECTCCDIIIPSYQSVCCYIIGASGPLALSTDTCRLFSQSLYMNSSVVERWLKLEPSPPPQSPGHLASLFSTICLIHSPSLSLPPPQRAEGSDALPGEPREGQPPERARRPAV